MNNTSRYPKANLPVHMMRGLVETVRELGIDPIRLVAGLGLDLIDLSSPSCRISLRQASEIVRRAVKMTPQRALGLEVGARRSIMSIGLVGCAMLTSPTIKGAISVGLELQRCTGTLLHFDLDATDEQILSMRATNVYLETDIEAFLVEEAFGNCMQIGRALTGEMFRPTSVDLSYPRPDYAEQYARVFQCPIRFEQQANRFSFPSAMADRVIATHDPLTHRQAMEFLQSSHSLDSDITEFLESIERIVRRDLRETPMLAAVASQMCMSERTLRRRLAECGTSYQTMVNEIRKKHAFKLLSNPRLSIDKIASEIGFSDANSFRRAFKHWTGHGPRECAATGLPF